MATLQQLITDRLANDPGLTAAQPAGLGFQVWSRWLKIEGPGATPDAFDKLQGNRMKRSIVVMDGGESRNAQRQPAGRWRWESFPMTHIFAEAHANGKQAAWDAKARIEALLVGWYVDLDGQRVGFLPEHVLALEDNEDFPGNVRLAATWRATSSRVLVPA